MPDLVGGRPALDFLNTVDPRHAPVRQEYLTDYSALLGVVDRLSAVLPAPVQTLRELAEADPEAAVAAHRQALQLRESLYAVFAAALTRQPPPAEALAVVNAQLCRATDHHQLRAAPEGGVRDGWVGEQALDSPLWPVVVDAWDLLTTDLIGRIRECPGEEGACGWLFLDSSRSGTRRWCDMRTCGNRAKVRTHYTRNR